MIILRASSTGKYGKCFFTVRVRLYKCSNIIWSNDSSGGELSRCCKHFFFIFGVLFSDFGFFLPLWRLYFNHFRKLCYIISFDSFANFFQMLLIFRLLWPNSISFYFVLFIDFYIIKSFPYHWRNSCQKFWNFCKLVWYKISNLTSTLIHGTLKS